MAGGDVELLDQRRRVSRGIEAQIAARGHLAPAPSGEADDDQPLAPRRLDRTQDVRRAPRGGDRDQHVAGDAKTQNLPLEDPLVAVIIADRGQNRAVGGQRDRRGRGAVIVEPGEKLAGEVLRVCRAAAIAGEQYLASGRERPGEPIYDRLGRRQEGRVVDRSLERIARLRQILDD